MLVGDNEIDVDFGDDWASELLNAINIVGSGSGQNIKRLDGSNFKLYWAGSVLRVDILDAPPAQHP